MARAFRGSGVRFTLPYVFKFLGLWIVVTVLAVLVFGVASYLLLTQRLLGPDQRDLALIILLVQTIVALAAIAILAVFTTHRLAGPMIALRRAFEDVKDGDLERHLRFRKADSHLLEVEAAFNEMMGSLRKRLEYRTAHGLLPGAAEMAGGHHPAGDGMGHGLGDAPAGKCPFTGQQAPAPSQQQGV
jgi:HAMP domain-containing protein